MRAGWKQNEWPGAMRISELESDIQQSLEEWLCKEQLGNLADQGLTLTAVLENFEVSATVDRILQSREAPQTNVALQFPDSLLDYAPLVCQALTLFSEHTLKAKSDDRKLFFFVLGDTSYGECCVDEVAAQHLSADIVVHYGNACLSPTRTLPVLFVFPRVTLLNAKRACESFESVMRGVVADKDIKRIVILYDLSLYSYFREDSFAIGSETVPFTSFDTSTAIHVSKLRIQDREQILAPEDEAWNRKDLISVGAHAFDASTAHMNETAFVWFTEDAHEEDYSPAVRNAALQLCTGPETCHNFSYASLSSRANGEALSVNASRILRKRFALMSKVQDAQRIGIVPGTLGISGNTEVIERCKMIIKSAGKRSYVMLVGKPNPAKLANFPEIEVFVLIACPQNALLDGKEYMQAIVTPMELEAALLKDGDIFSSPYSADFRQVLSKELAIDKDAENADDTNDASVAARGDWAVSVHGEGGAAEFLNQRFWSGLKFGEGGVDDKTDMEDLSTDVIQGQTGIASRYEKEL